MDNGAGHYELRRVSDIEWMILDRRFPPHDSRRDIARIYEVDASEWEVVWERDLSFRTVYTSPTEVLRDLSASSRQTKPIEIPHAPPHGSWAGRSTGPDALAV